MHFFIDKNSLVNAISHVSKAVSSKNTIPILSGIKFEVSHEGLILTGSDSDITILITISKLINENQIVKIINDGKVVLPRYIVDIVKKLPSEEIEFKLVDRQTVIIKSGFSEFSINSYDVEEYPELPLIDKEKSFNIESKLLKTMIKQTNFAVSFNESRPILSGVLWNLDEDTLKLISTDSHRLAIREGIVDNPSQIKLTNVVIPGKSLQELYKILDNYNTIVNITVTNNQILIKIDNLIFFSRLLDGTYPDISRIIPKNGNSKIVLQNTVLLDAIERAALIAKESKNNIVKLSSLESNIIEISSNLHEIGKVTETIEVKEFIGEIIKISFNSKYVLDALKVIDSNEISIEFTGALSPFVIKPIDHDKMLYLILPIRTY
ncbi:MAG: DNA polymerase III subunit beta [Vulcanibacillus sp.]